MNSRTRCRQVCVKQRTRKIRDIAGALAHQGKRRRPPRGQPAGELIFLEREVGLELRGQMHHSDVVGLADDFDRLDPMIARRPHDPAEQLLADAATTEIVFDAERGLGVDVTLKRRLFAPDRLLRTQLAAPRRRPSTNAPNTRSPWPKQLSAYCAMKSSDMPPPNRC